MINMKRGIFSSIRKLLSFSYSNTAFNIGSSLQTKTPTITNGDGGSKLFALVSGSLPNGVTLNTSSGVLTGPNAWNFPANENNANGTLDVTGIAATNVSGIPDNGAIVVGYFTSGTITLGSTTLNNAGKQTAFIAKINSSGSWLWASANTGIGSIGPTVSVTATSDGGGIVSGYFQTSSITLGSTTLSLAGTTTLFVSKVSSTGVFTWSATNTGTGTSSQVIPVATSDGGAIITGSFSGSSITFGSTTLSLAGSNTIFAAKISSSGSWSWASTNTGTGSIIGVSIAGTSDGGAILTGSFSGSSITFSSTTLSLSGSANIFVTKISSAGAWSWALTNTGTGAINQTPTITITSDGNAIVNSYFLTASVTFGSTTLSLAGTNTIFAAKVTSAGAWSWASTNTGSGTVLASSISATSDGGAIITGRFITSSITLGSTTLSLSGSGSVNIFVAKITSAGVWSWASTNTGTGGFNSTPIVLVTSDNGAIIVSNFNGASVTFGSTTLALAGIGPTFTAKVSSTGSWSWANANTGTGSVGGSVFAVGTSDSGAIVAGTFQTSSITFGSTALALAGIFTLYSSKISSTGSWSWASTNTTVTTGNVNSIGTVFSIAGTTDGGAVVVGTFSGGPIIFGSNILSLAGSNTIFIAKITSAGVWSWALANTGTGSLGTNPKVSATSDGGAIVLGTFSSASVTFGPTTLSLAGTNTLFVTKVSSAGAFSWANSNTGSGTVGTTPTLVATSDNGAIITNFFQSSSVTFGSTTLSLAGTNTILVTKVSSAGAWSWASTNTGTGTLTITPNIAGTSDGGAIVTGYFQTSSITLGSTTLSLAGTNTAFVAKITSAGAWSWASANTGTGTISISTISIAATSDGGAIIAGYFSSASVTFGATTLALAGTNTIFVVKVSSTGTFSWAARNTGTGIIQTILLAGASDGGAIVYGYFTSASVTFNSTTLSLAGTNTLFVAKVTSAGAWSWASTNTGTGSATASQQSAIVATSDGGAIISGSFTSSSIIFSSTTLSLAGITTSFIAKITSSGAWSWANSNSGTGVLSTRFGLLSTSDGGAIISSTFSSGPATGPIIFGSTTLSLAGANTLYLAKLTPTGVWGSTDQTTQGFPSTVTISATDTYGTSTNTPKLTAI